MWAYASIQHYYQLQLVPYSSAHGLDVKNVWHLSISTHIWPNILTFYLQWQKYRPVQLSNIWYINCSHTVIPFDPVWQNHPIKSYYHSIPNNGGKNNFTTNGNLTRCHQNQTKIATRKPYYMHLHALRLSYPNTFKKSSLLSLRNLRCCTFFRNC